MPIFSRYSNGENRVTSSILSVFKRLSLPVYDFLLRGLIKVDSSETLHTITNQPSSGGDGIPDGEMSASYRILIETKITDGGDDEAQLTRHLERFKNDKHDVQVLVYLTTDEDEPEVVNQMNNTKLMWQSFAVLDGVLESLLEGIDGLRVSTIEKFMIEELRLMIENEDLIPSRDNVVVVGAKIAWPMYQENKIYICQQNRSFRKVEYIGFYTNGEIMPKIAKIKNRYPDVTLESEEIEGNLELLAKIKAYIKAHDTLPNTNANFFSGAFQVFDLEGEEVLNSAILNDCTAKKTGRRVAYTQGQRYTSMEKLRTAQTTSDLV